MAEEVKVNDEVLRSPVSFQQADENYKAVHGPIPGKVVYVHPKKAIPHRGVFRGW